MRKVLVFGVFDGLHKGHFSFLKQAGKLGDYFIVVVARDGIVKKMKSHLPKFNSATRIRDLKKEKAADKIVLGDRRMGSYGVIARNTPDIIALGYDQKALKADLLRAKKKFGWKFMIKTLRPYMPRHYHSGLLK